MKNPLRRLLLLDIFLFPCAWLFLASIVGSQDFVYDYVYFNGLWFSWMIPVTFSQCLFLPYILGIVFIVQCVIYLIRQHEQSIPLRGNILRFCALLALYICEVIALPFAFMAIMSV